MRDLDADAAKAQNAHAHARELASEIQPLGPPPSTAHETIGQRDLPATGKRQGDRQIGDVVEKHRRRRQDDAALANGGKIAGLEADAVERTDFEFRH